MNPKKRGGKLRRAWSCQGEATARLLNMELIHFASVCHVILVILRFLFHVEALGCVAVHRSLATMLRTSVRCSVFIPFSA